MSVLRKYLVTIKPKVISTEDKASRNQCTVDKRKVTASRPVNLSPVKRGGRSRE